MNIWEIIWDKISFEENISHYFSFVLKHLFLIFGSSTNPPKLEGKNHIIAKLIAIT